MKKCILLLFLCSFVSLNAESLSMLVMGDLLIANAVEKRMEQYGKAYPFKKLKKTLEGYDVVFANLETPVTTRGVPHPTKKWVFRTKPKNAEYLKRLNLHVLSLANNHMLDFGEAGLVDTLSFVKKANFYYSGAGLNLAAARKPAIFTKKGVKFVFLSYCERPPMDMYASPTKAGIAPINIELIKEDVSRYKGDKTLVFVSLHWGIERTSYPRKDQIETAHQIIDAGASAIIGHHPHVPQGIEIYKGVPILYSLGNAVCGFYNKKYTNNILVDFRYDGITLKKLEIIPIAGDNYKIHCQPYVEVGEEAKKSLLDIKRFSSPFGTYISIDNNRGVVRINSK